jgi:multiple sugar transport system ATP-binding protein
MASVTFEAVGKRYPNGTVAVKSLDLHIDDGEFMVFVGPSGCGKTTALRMVAGLEEITDGELLIGETAVTRVEPRKRDVAMVFQSYALYPHMSVFSNIAFPLQAHGIPKAQIREDVERVARMLGLTELLERRPRVLSGGQRQRVAMGRALVRKPQVFLMDEPLSNLDAKLRTQMRGEIAALQHDLGATTIYVTHDQVEAMTMGDRIAVMRKGVLQQVGSAEAVYDRPANLFTATFIGSPAMNLFRARVTREDDGLSCVVGDQTLKLPALSGFTPPELAAFAGREVALGIRPEHLSDGTSSNGGPRIRGTVRLVETLGSERLVHVDVEADPVVTEDVLELARDTDAAAVEALQQESESHRVSAIVRFDARAKAKMGMPADLAVDLEGLHFFDLENGDTIR